MSANTGLLIEGKKPEMASAFKGHPCFDESAHNTVGRMHIPVAPKCNIQCRYCHRQVGSSENRPGVAYKILKPVEALKAVEETVERDPSIWVIGVAGPGDALANEATFNSLSLINKKFPDLIKCVSTNGLCLEERVDDLVAVGVSTISVTLNAVDPSIGREFYKRVNLDGRNYYENAFDVLSVRQLSGIEYAVKKGLVVKVNTVLVPELNLDHIEEIAKTIKSVGVSLMNIMALLPIGDMSGYRAPTCIDLEEARSKAGKHIEQFRACKQCRADAVGIPGRSGQFHTHNHGNEQDFGKGKTLSDIFTGVPLYH
jgi:nitrogen fixation protein NifB